MRRSSVVDTLDASSALTAAAGLFSDSSIVSGSLAPADSSTSQNVPSAPFGGVTSAATPWTFNAFASRADRSRRASAA